MSSSGFDRVRARVAQLVFLLVCILVSPLAAQSPNDAVDRAAARRLAAQGFSELEQGQPSAAERSFTRALALYKAPTLYLARGRARLQLSWLLAASEDFRAAASFALAADETPAYASARADAALEWSKLERRLPTLTVQLTGDAKELRVNGVAWPIESVGVARPLDPGRHLVEAVDYHGQVHSSSILLQESNAATVSLSLPARYQAAQALAPAPAAVAVASPAAGSGGPAHPSAPAEALRRDRSPIPTAAWVSGGVTLALVAGAVVTGVLALNRRAEYNENNVAGVPMERKRDLRDSAQTMAWVNTAFVGSALLGGGLTTYFLLAQPSADVSAPQAREAQLPAARAAVAGVRVAF